MKKEINEYLHLYSERWMDGKGQDTPALDKQGHRKNRKLMIGR